MIVSDKQMLYTKLSNIVGIQTQPFDAAKYQPAEVYCTVFTFSDLALQEAEEQGDDDEEKRMKGKLPEHMMRWRTLPDGTVCLLRLSCSNSIQLVATDSPMR